LGSNERVLSEVRGIHPLGGMYNILHPRRRRAAGHDMGLVDINVLTDRRHPGQLGGVSSLRFLWPNSAIRSLPTIALKTGAPCPQQKLDQ